MQKKTHTIDASGKTLGRVASEAAKALMGKMSADYTPHILSNVDVTISNTDKLSTRERKQLQTTYTRYSGYPGGFKTETLQALNRRKGSTEAVRRAVERMLPRNTMRTARMKHLTITK